MTATACPTSRLIAAATASDRHRPRERRLLQAGGGTPPEREVREAAARPTARPAASAPRRARRDTAGPTVDRRRGAARPSQHGQRPDEHRAPRQTTPQIERHDDGVGRAGDQSGSARPQADRGGRAEQHAGEDADAQAGGQRQTRRPRAPCRRRRARSDRRARRGSRARAAGRAARRRAVRLGEPGAQSSVRQNRRSATNSASSFSRAARRPNGASAVIGGRAQLGRRARARRPRR